LVERAVAAVEPSVLAARGRVDAEIAESVWSLVDDEAMTIAVSNLLENALKYGGDPVEIRVKLHVTDDEAVLEVSDNGDGIAEEEIPFVFDRFYRAGDEMTRTSQGTGLGLYLVQRIVKAHHGTVKVADTGGGGTRFCITLPKIGVGEERA
jgi:signal transduction histidine kinase